MKFTVFTAALLATGISHADGFNCQTAEGDLNVSVYNHVQPELGTRSAATMIVSNPAIQTGRKTIAKFTAANGTLSSRLLTYTANVDLRFNDSGRKGELISGTKLGELDNLVLDVDFSYSPREILAHGESTTAELTLVKRNGATIVRDMICSRYLKGE